MFGCDKTLTLVNTVTDGRTDETKLYAHVFTGCGWYAENGVQAEKSGQTASGKTKVRLPVDRCPGYVSPAAWAALDEAARAESWTLDGATYILPGVIESAPATATDIYVARKAGSAIQVTAWHDHRDTVFPHLYAEGS
jgi:hypothetical protein